LLFEDLVVEGFGAGPLTGLMGFEGGAE